jgi:hypothetical protein
MRAHLNDDKRPQAQRGITDSSNDSYSPAADDMALTNQALEALSRLTAPFVVTLSRAAGVSKSWSRTRS